MQSDGGGWRDKWTVTGIPGKNLPNGVVTHTYGEKRRQVLRDNDFGAVRDAFSAYTEQMLA